VTETELINLTLEAAGKTEQQLPRFRILGLVTAGLETLAKRVATQAGYQGLQKDFLVAPVAGRLDLSAVPGLLFDPARVEVRIAASGAGVTMIDNVKTLEYGGLPKDQVFCAREGDELVFRDLTGALNTYATAIQLKASQIPTLGGLKPQYKGALAAIIAELATSAPVAQPELTGARV
jgi:hypothetical protein